MSATAGVYLLKMKHAALLEEHRGDPELGPGLRDGVPAFIVLQLAEREAGTGFAFVIEDSGRLVGAASRGSSAPRFSRRSRWP